VKVDPELQRGTAELHDLVGDPSRARARLGWHPEVDFEGLVRLLVDADLALVRGETPAASTMERR
jgi:GDPmannose 4,6-dehydratase